MLSASIACLALSVSGHWAKAGEGLGTEVNTPKPLATSEVEQIVLPPLLQTGIPRTCLPSRPGCHTDVPRQPPVHTSLLRAACTLHIHRHYAYMCICTDNLGPLPTSCIQLTLAPLPPRPYRPCGIRSPGHHRGIQKYGAEGVASVLAAARLSPPGSIQPSPPALHGDTQ